MSGFVTGNRQRWSLPALVFVASAALWLASMTLAQAQGAETQGAVGSPARSSSVNDAYMVLVPEGPGPENGDTVNVGDRFVLGLWIDSGSNSDLTAAQAYLTFTHDVLQNVAVSSITTGCVQSALVTPDTSRFEAQLFNQVCNGPDPCNGQVYPQPGAIGYAAGALSNPPTGGMFRIARIGICATAVGQATLHWQFSPPAPSNRNTRIVAVGGTVQDAALFSDYIINVVVGPTRTSTATASVSPTSTPSASPSASATRTPGACGISFSDVATVDYFYEPVRYLYCAGAISGYSDGTFRPYNNTTRGQLSKIVVLAESFPINVSGGPHFSDVPPSNAFYQYIETAYNRGIISGYADGTFRWGNDVTRGQLCKIVVVAEQWAIDTTSGPHFGDVPAGHPFYEYVETAYNRQIISGYADGIFRPGNPATRGQISKIVYNALNSP
jgi:hypothetical protein